ncbi:hypothetical protein PanWU01x14_232110, partial [Parasponia andersonii]
SDLGLADGNSSRLRVSLHEFVGTELGLHVNAPPFAYAVEQKLHLHQMQGGPDRPYQTLRANRSSQARMAKRGLARPYGPNKPLVGPKRTESRLTHEWAKRTGFRLTHE